VIETGVPRGNSTLSGYPLGEYETWRYKTEICQTRCIEVIKMLQHNAFWFLHRLAR